MVRRTCHRGGGVRDDVKNPNMSFPAHMSNNLIDWTPIGPTLKRDLATSWGTDFFWAPEVYYRDGRYVMVYSAQWRNNPMHEDENFHIGIAVSDSPRGPFLDVRNEPLFDLGWPVIDADVLFDDDGRGFMYFSRCCYKHSVDTELSELVRTKGWFQTVEESWIYGIEIKPDFSGVIGDPVLILRPVRARNRRRRERSREADRGGAYALRRQDLERILCPGPSGSDERGIVCLVFGGELPLSHGQRGEGSYQRAIGFRQGLADRFERAPVRFNRCSHEPLKDTTGGPAQQHTEPEPDREM